MKKRIVILGGGESGVGAALLAVSKGFEVFVSDNGRLKEKYRDVLSNAGIGFEEGRHTEERVLGAEEVIKSPGIPDDVPLIGKIRKKGIRMVSETEFAARYTHAPKICITGSNGKTTTTLLTCHILQRAGLNCGLAGNVGTSFAWKLTQPACEIYVLEISSFQLDHMYDFRAETAVILNITPDHLDRYGYRFDEYVRSKFRITRNQRPQDALIYNADDPVIGRELKNQDIRAQLFPFSIRNRLTGNGAWLEDNHLVVNIDSNRFTMTIDNLALQGKHNIYNSMAASIAARIFDIRKDPIKESLADFQNIEHRLEFVARIHGVDFINDSKATNVNSTWYALESMAAPVVWIAGGIDKGNDYSVLYDLVKTKVKALICLGRDNKALIRAFSDLLERIVETTSMEEAVRWASYIGRPNDVVLLSPACASFDLFENFEDRGNQFKEAVKSL
ncbi:MAG: UDP-N-acetylmuramoyl-L-alanine--D-glutamate ligase [Bacteroidales bacterium]|nr:UDP-N-acetylmuramoyl-L-alanine--D-glutamate ligase [Bacteroidales bacterium]